MRLDFIKGQEPLVEAFRATLQEVKRNRGRLGELDSAGKGDSAEARELLKKTQELAARAKTEGNRVINAARTAMTAAQADAERVQGLQERLDAKSGGSSSGHGKSGSNRHPSSLVRAS